MGNGDISDLHQRGVPVDDLVEAARLEQAVLPTDAARMQEQGVALIRELRDEVLKAQSASAASLLVAKLLEDDSRMQALGFAWCGRPDLVSACILQMRDLRGMARSIDSLERAIRRQKKAAQVDHERREESYQAILLDRMLAIFKAKGIKAPKGWLVGLDCGVQSPDGKQVCTQPLVILGSSVDVDTGNARLHLAWATPGGWVDRHVPRSVAMNHRKLVDLAEAQAPVSSVTSSSVVRYLTAFEQENDMEATRSSAHMGWVDDRTFLHGDTPIGEPVVIAVEDSERKTVSAFHKSGTYEDWLDLVSKEVAPRPLVMAGLLVSAASALLYPLRREGFAFEWSGLTSGGKTSSMRVAASVWGNPHENGAIGKWNAAGISGLLRTAWLNQSIPLFLDDTKEAKAEVVRDIMYIHSSGRDRTRGTQTGGLRHTNTWASVLISTGEAPITSFSKDQGARARCITLKGRPFGPGTEENRQSAARVKNRLLEHYGHLGPHFAAWLADHPTRWNALRVRHEQIATELCVGFSDPMSCRLLEHVAVVKLTADLLTEHLGLDLPFGPAIDAMVAAVKAAEPQADLPQLAADELYAWAASNERQFYRRSSRPPETGWVGRWDPDTEDKPWTCIGIQETIVARKLKEWGYDVSSILEAWKGRGWRKLDKRGANPNYGPGGARLLVLVRDAFGGIQ